MTLSEQTAARLERAGITWDDPGLARIQEQNREAVLRAELAALKGGRPMLKDDCGWPSCPVHRSWLVRGFGPRRDPADYTGRGVAA